MSRRVNVYLPERETAGWVTKYVGATALSMGSDPVYRAVPSGQPSLDSHGQRVFFTWTEAADYLRRRYIADAQHQPLPEQ